MVEPGVLKQLRTILQSYSLLYVEDNVGLNTQVTALFKKIFETVYTAYDGEEGLALFKEHHPSIVITDI
ncbi:MAG: response regulator, partial [Sulfuricurvum sp.]|nr:response regulator [Sulfuricurvum sp.]